MHTYDLISSIAFMTPRVYVILGSWRLGFGKYEPDRFTKVTKSRGIPVEETRTPAAETPRTGHRTSMLWAPATSLANRLVVEKRVPVRTLR